TSAYAVSLHDALPISDEWLDPALGGDAIVRGEGDVTFRELLRAYERGDRPARVDGLWYRDGDAFRRNPPRRVATLTDGDIRPRQIGRAHVLTPVTERS